MRVWLAICAVLGGGAAIVAWTEGLASPFHDLAAQPLAWDAAGWLAAPWTLWTSAWVHTSAGSLTGNLLALLALAVLGAALGAGRVAALALALAWPLTTLALLLWPEVGSYGGLGGPIHAAAAVLGVHIARRTALRPLAALLFGAIGLKLLAERGWAQPVAFDPSWGFNVVYAAHLAGTLTGAWCATVLDWFLAPRAAAGEQP
ncbi:rhomboid family intramembrane serine protease [Ramlibacter sp.]|uniref:rhomboid family intramembrane serine protease n=1 Tax=Ramlibacter sp. TaxID=1917967 RepID=UPI002D10F76C|nr:rhomboid family intramembrane serine protease [Ramlibacter sp.]HWI84017.1 rhomboid family intramembrane serine protease [Ramlibacter sp.]